VDAGSIGIGGSGEDRDRGRDQESREGPGIEGDVQPQINMIIRIIPIPTDTLEELFSLFIVREDMSYDFVGSQDDT
jgi:hypothetical protein